MNDTEKDYLIIVNSSEYHIIKAYTENGALYKLASDIGIPIDCTCDEFAKMPVEEIVDMFYSTSQIVVDAVYQLGLCYYDRHDTIDNDIIEINPDIAELVEANDGYCPCAIEKNKDTHCPCKEFREQPAGTCTCGRFEKV